MDEHCSIAIRRLSSKADRKLYEAAYRWDVAAPTWYTAQDIVFRPELEEFLSPPRTRADIGIFERGGDLVGLLTTTWHAGGDYEVHLWAKRGASVNILYEGMRQIRESMVRDLGAQRITAWVTKRNRHVIRLCYDLGLRESGFVMIHGTYRNRLIEWQQFVLDRDWMAIEKAA